MMYFLSLCVALISAFSHVATAGLPVFVAPCELFDPLKLECWGRSMVDSLPLVVTGIDELRHQTEPLQLPKHSISETKSKTATYELYIKKIAVTGASRYRITDGRVDLDEPIMKLKIDFPLLKVVMDARITSVILGHHFNGTCEVEYTFKNILLDFLLDGDEHVIYGKKYVVWREGSIEATYDSASVNVRNFNDDPELPTQINTLLNENPEVVAEHVGPIIAKTFGHFIIGLINKVYRAYPIDVLYPSH